MGMLSAVVYTPPLTLQDAGALKEGFPDLNFKWVTTPAGECAGATLGEWALLWYTRNGASRIPRLAPYAVPNPYSKYGGTLGASFSYPSGLYFVSDSPPARDTGELDRPIVGVIVGVAITSAGATLSVTHADGHVSTVPIPADVASNSAGVAFASSPFYAIIDYPSALASTTTSGCTVPFYADLRAPRGIIVDPNPANWLSGYSLFADDSAASLPGIELGSDAGFHSGYVDPSVIYREFGLSAATVGGRSLPRVACVKQRIDYPGGWLRLETNGYARPRLAQSGVVYEQACGHFAREVPHGDGDISSFGDVFSSPARLIVDVDGLSNYGGASRTVTVTEYNMDGSGGTVIYSGAFNDTTHTAHDIALPTTLSPFKRYKITRTPEQDYYGTQVPYITVALVASWKHPLPFTVVASDGTVIPAGIASAHLTALASVPNTTETVISGVGSTAAPSGRATAGWRVRASGLSPGMYNVNFNRSISNDGMSAILDAAGGVQWASGTVLAPGGTFSAAISNIADGDTISISSASSASYTLALGANVISRSPFLFASFTAPATGVYTFGLKGSGSANLLSMFASKTDPLVCSGIISSVANFTRRVYQILRQNSPPAYTSPLGKKQYLIGDSPTGDWAGQAGKLAAGLVGPAAFSWSFRDGQPGDWIENAGDVYHFQAWSGAFVRASDPAGLGSLSIPLTAGETVYLRVCASGVQRPDFSDMSYIVPSIYGVPASVSTTITVASL